MKNGKSVLLLIHAVLCLVVPLGFGTAAFAQEGTDLGDAPEGALAYPATGVLGSFPTCIGVGPAAWIHHTNFGAYFGGLDYEPEGNGGVCPLFNPNSYDRDECFADGDAGLMFPPAYTIGGPIGQETVVPCSGQGGLLGYTCDMAVWGKDIDIHVHNTMPNHPPYLTAYVNVLMDWDQNGKWVGGSACPQGGAPEHVLVNFAIPPLYIGPLSGLNPAPFRIGPNAGYVWTRFTITEKPVPLPWEGDGTFEDGETEDYLLRVDEKVDFGDAPDPSYPTLLVNNGARHRVAQGIYLGNQTDNEPDGQPNANADGDDTNGVDDEDGVVFPALLVQGQSATLAVTASTAGKLDAWIDFNADGDWADTGEQIFAAQSLSAGNNSLNIAVPGTAKTGTTYARFRFSTAGGLSYNGWAQDGEVEDYQLTIYESGTKWVQPPDLSRLGLDINALSSFILADDFQCTTTGPITDITVWASWYHDIVPIWEGKPDPSKVILYLSIHKDIPAKESPTGYSMPGEVLWWRYFAWGASNGFTVSTEATGLSEGWLDPGGQYDPNGDTVCYRYDFHLDPLEFVQRGTPEQPVTYWLDVQASPVIPQVPMPLFGWKTSSRHWNDDAVWGPGVEPNPGPWSELRYPPGHPLQGQSIDLAFVIRGREMLLDWGDAPDPSYPTTAASNGANHMLSPNLALGNTVDAEPDGQPDPNALGDDNNFDDEEGVLFTMPLVQGWTASVDVTASAAGRLDAWVDFNADSDWADSGEQIFASQPVSFGVNSLPVTVPSSAKVGLTFARFRLSTLGGLSYTGQAADGEVEDYQVQVYPAPVTVTKGRAKQLSVGSWVLIKDNAVTANFGLQGWYFEEKDRSAGLGVFRQPAAAGPWFTGDLVSCYGQTVLKGCELMLLEVYSWRTGVGPLTPVGQNNRSSGGGPFGNQPGVMDDVVAGKAASGTNSVALLVRLWGRCTWVDAVQGCFWLDDGSGLVDGTLDATGSPVLGVKVRIPPNLPTLPLVGRYYAVTGIMRTDTSPAGVCTRWLWPRDASDIVCYTCSP